MSTVVLVGMCKILMAHMLMSIQEVTAVDDNKIILTAARVRFYSENDELAFFEWLDKIECIQSYNGQSDILHITIVNNGIDDISLREIIAIFYRYGIDMKQLVKFKNKENREWFCDSHKYWFKRVFGAGVRSTKRIDGAM